MAASRLQPVSNADRAREPIAADGFSQRMCEHIAAWHYEMLPQAVVQIVKLLLLDSLGVTAGAARAPGIAQLNARLEKWESSGSATGLIGKRGYSPPSASLANGTAAHALDFDDQHDPARVHTACVVLPTLLATAEDVGAISGRDFILCMAIGAELHARLGLACYNSLGKGWHPTMVLGTLAAGMAAGRMLRLGAESLNDALGIAFHQAAGSAQSMRDGALAKRLGAGFAARAAVLGAFLAADGLTGPRRTFEGSAGLFALYERNEVNPEILIDELGTSWRIPEYSFKPYPCCRCNHTAIGLGIALKSQGVRGEEVAAVEICMGEVNRLTVGEPYDARRNDVVHAQFNAAYSFARALMDGAVDLRSYQKPAITDPRIAGLAGLTRVLNDPAIDAAAIEPARVTLTLKDGRTLEASRDTIKGSPRDPMSGEELLAKFRDCLDFGLGASRVQADRLAETIFGLEESRDAAADIVAAFPAAR